MCGVPVLVGRHAKGSCEEFELLGVDIEVRGDLLGVE